MHTFWSHQTFVRPDCIVSSKPMTMTTTSNIGGGEHMNGGVGSGGLLTLGHMSSHHAAAAAAAAAALRQFGQSLPTGTTGADPQLGGGGVGGGHLSAFHHAHLNTLKQFNLNTNDFHHNTNRPGSRSSNGSNGNPMLGFPRRSSKSPRSSPSSAGRHSPRNHNNNNNNSSRSNKRRQRSSDDTDNSDVDVDDDHREADEDEDRHEAKKRPATSSPPSMNNLRGGGSFFINDILKGSTNASELHSAFLRHGPTPVVPGQPNSQHLSPPTTPPNNNNQQHPLLPPPPPSHLHPQAGFGLPPGSVPTSGAHPNAYFFAAAMAAANANGKPIDPASFFGAAAGGATNNFLIPHAAAAAALSAMKPPFGMSGLGPLGHEGPGAGLTGHMNSSTNGGDSDCDMDGDGDEDGCSSNEDGKSLSLFGVRPGSIRERVCVCVLHIIGRQCLPPPDH